MKNKIRKNQRRIPGGRDSLPSCVIHEIKYAVQREADRYNVSRSFVVAVLLAKAFRIPIDEY